MASSCCSRDLRGIWLNPSQYSGDLHFVELLVDVFRGREITHGGLEGLVAHPVLHGADIKASPQHASSVGGTELPQIKFLGIEAGAFGDGFAFVEHVQFAIAARRRKHEPAFLDAG